MIQQRVDRREHDLSDLVRTTLTRQLHLFGRRVEVELQQDNEVVLKGFVRSYYHKQLAQESVRRIDGVDRVSNEIEVVAV